MNPETVAQALSIQFNYTAWALDANLKDLSGMIADFNAVQPLLLGGLRRLDAALFAAPAPFSPRNDPDETVGTLLIGLAFHEAYHVGQLGALRRAIGRDGVIA